MGPHREKLIMGPHREKTYLWGSRQGKTLTNLLIYRDKLKNCTFAICKFSLLHFSETPFQYRFAGGPMMASAPPPPSGSAPGLIVSKKPKGRYLNIPIIFCEFYRTLKNAVIKLSNLIVYFVHERQTSSLFFNKMIAKLERTQSNALQNNEQTQSLC